MKIVVAILIALSVAPCWSQTDLMHCTDSTYCVPAIIGLPRSKGIELKQERVFNYGIQSSANDSSFTGNNATINRNRRWTFRARFPILLKPNFKLAGGISYDVEEFTFRGIEDIDHPFYTGIEDKNLKSLGAALYAVKPFLGNKFLMGRASAKANGDFVDFEDNASDYMKYSATLMCGVKLAPHKNIAVGATINYTFGRRVVFPVLAYNHTFNSKWGIESLLPIFMRVRYRPNDHNQFYLKSELAGANYNLRLNGDEGNVTYYLQKAELRLLLSYEREIHDWLWFGVEAGARRNLDFDLSNEFNRPRPTVILENNLNDAFVANFSIFIVPPQKWTDPETLKK